MDMEDLQTIAYHNPVLLAQSVEGLNIKPNGCYVDLTYGSGGHSAAILEQLDENGRLFAFDQDLDSKANAISDSRFTLINHNFKHIKNHLRFYGVTAINGILGDLGVSSHQFDCGERGFSTRFDGPLDMRMDTRKGLKAADILQTYTESELSKLFYQYGEIHNANRLAALIVKERAAKPFSTSKDFIDRIQSCVPKQKDFILCDHCAVCSQDSRYLKNVKAHPPSCTGIFQPLVQQMIGPSNIVTASSM
jgi:16S rRNA (cytosine1402-N4)-methyltransferase